MHKRKVKMIKVKDVFEIVPNFVSGQFFKINNQEKYNLGGKLVRQLLKIIVLEEGGKKFISVNHYNKY